MDIATTKLNQHRGQFSENLNFYLFSNSLSYTKVRIVTKIPFHDSLYEYKVSILIATFMKSESSLLADTSLYVDWQSMQ